MIAHMDASGFLALLGERGHEEEAALGHVDALDAAPAQALGADGRRERVSGY